MRRVLGAEHVRPAELVEIEIGTEEQKLRAVGAGAKASAGSAPASLRPTDALRFPLIKMQADDCVKAVCPRCKMPLLGQTFYWDRVRGRLRIVGACVSGIDTIREGQHEGLELIAVHSGAVQGYLIEIEALMIASDEWIGDAEEPVTGQMSGEEFYAALRADFDQVIERLDALRRSELVRPSL